MAGDAVKALEILQGWVLLFMVVCWTIIDIGDAVAKYSGLHLWASIVSALVVGVMLLASVWRDRLA